MNNKIIVSFEHLFFSNETYNYYNCNVPNINRDLDTKIIKIKITTEEQIDLVNVLNSKITFYDAYEPTKYNPKCSFELQSIFYRCILRKRPCKIKENTLTLKPKNEWVFFDIDSDFFDVIHLRTNKNLKIYVQLTLKQKIDTPDNYDETVFTVPIYIPNDETFEYALFVSFIRPVSDKTIINYMSCQIFDKLFYTTNFIVKTIGNYNVYIATPIKYDDTELVSLRDIKKCIETPSFYNLMSACISNITISTDPPNAIIPCYLIRW